MLFFESLEYFLSRNFKNSEAYELLNGKLDNYPYDYLRYVRFKRDSYSEFNQGAQINYKVDPEYPRNITVYLDVFDGMKYRKITFEIRNGGNEVNLITRTPREDTNVFHVKCFNSSDTFNVNVLNKVVKFYNTPKEQTTKFSFAQFDKEGNLITYRDGNSVSDDKKYKGKRFA